MINELSDIELIKKGGQKEVYLAYHKDYGRVVFKKIFPSNDSLIRTKREVRAVSLLQNATFIPNIISHNCEEDSPPFLWIVEEFVTGANLRDVFRSNRVFNINDIVRFLDTTLEIAVLSEQNNLVHRDIKPENIILDNHDNFWLLDFGIARHLDLESITGTNDVFGPHTIGYASSEQFKNLKKEIDIRADLFSIGVVCHEMIRGQNYYTTDVDNDVFKVLKKLENSSLPPLRIEGDTQFLLSTFISLLGDHRRNRRPRTAQEALSIFNSLLETLRVG
jgi:serine/threonine protein kinase